MLKKKTEAKRECSLKINLFKRSKKRSEERHRDRSSRAPQTTRDGDQGKLLRLTADSSASSMRRLFVRDFDGELRNPMSEITLCWRKEMLPKPQILGDSRENVKIDVIDIVIEEYGDITIHASYPTKASIFQDCPLHLPHDARHALRCSTRCDGCCAACPLVCTARH